MEALIGVALFVIAVIWLIRWDKRYRLRRIEKRNQAVRDKLTKKYGDSPYVDAMLEGTIWIGMTAEQLVDTWGPPVAIDTRRLKTKVSQTYKYVRTRRRGFRQRVKVDDGIVVGWTNN